MLIQRYMQAVVSLDKYKQEHIHVHVHVFLVQSLYNELMVRMSNCWLKV